MADILPKLKEKLEKFVNDITTLEVTTISGSLEVSVILSTVNNKKKVDFDKIWGQLTPAAGAPPSTLTLIASTKVDFDKDVTQYVRDPLTDSQKDLVVLHNEAVKSSTEARKAAIESLVSIAKGLFGQIS